jgi:hypothetical protein
MRKTASARWVLLPHVLQSRVRNVGIPVIGLLTLAIQPLAIDGGATDHYIVDDRETALTTDPVALAVLDATVR